MPASSSSCSLKRLSEQRSSTRFFQNCSMSWAPGNAPLMPMMAMSKSLIVAPRPLAALHRPKIISPLLVTSAALGRGLCVTARVALSHVRQRLGRHALRQLLDGRVFEDVDDLQVGVEPPVDVFHQRDRAQ